MTGFRLETSSIGESEQIFVRRYAPLGSTPARTLVIVHGAGEHSGRYEHFIAKTLDRNWTVIAGDLRGHGQSRGVPTHLDTFDDYLKDLDVIWRHFQLEGRETALFGHSMGGLVAARYAQTRPGNVGHLILSSPLLSFGLRVPRLKATLGRVCLLVAPRTRFRTMIPPEQITRNEQALLIREQDPLSNRTVTAGWYFRVLDALLDVWAAAPRLAAPLLVLQGDSDRVVDADAPLRWMPLVGSSDKSLWVIPGHLHELLNEPGWELTAARVLDWLEHRSPPAGGCAGPDSGLYGRLPDTSRSNGAPAEVVPYVA
jgi:lysophospholipase